VPTFILEPYFESGAGALATVSYDYDGSTASYSIPYPWLDQSNFTGGAGLKSDSIKVFSDNLEKTTGWYMTDSSTVVFTTLPPIAYEKIIIRRNTSIEETKVTYQGGAIVDQVQLNRAKLADLYRFQEMQDRLYELWGFFGQPRSITYYSRTTDGLTAVYTLYDSETAFENDIVNPAEIIVQVGSQRLHPFEYTLDKDISGYVTVTLAELPPSGLTITFTTLAVGDPQSIDVAVQIADGSITADKLVLPLLTRATWSDFVDINDGTSEDAEINDVLIWSDNLGGGTVLEMRAMTPSDIPGFNAGVIANTLDTFAAPVASVNLNSQKITGLADGVALNDAATVGQAASASENFMTSDKIPKSSFPASLITGLTNGDYFVVLECTTTNVGTGWGTYPVKMSCQGQVKTRNLTNWPDGTTPISYTFIATVTDGTITIGQTNQYILSVDSSTGFRVS